MTPVKNYQGRNESRVFIALDFEMFLDGFHGHKRGLNFSAVTGNQNTAVLCGEYYPSF